MNQSTLPQPFRGDVLEVDGDQVQLLGSRCGSCGQLAFPQRRVCANCQSAAHQEPLRLSQAGTLYTYAIVRQAPRQFPTPYVIGYVDLDEGVRVFTQIVTKQPESLRLGMRMTLTSILMESPVSGDSTVAYAFQPDAADVTR